MVKAEKNYKIRFLRMPLNSRIWDLAGVHPGFVMVLLLMLLHDRFLANFGGRNHHPMRLNISLIFTQILTIMSDTQSFPFFSRCDILKMFAYHGATLHIVGAFCGPITPFNCNEYFRNWSHILRRVLSGIVSKSKIASCFEVCLGTLLSYPLSIPQSPLRVELCDWNFSFNTIFQILSLSTIFPEANAILDISSANLSGVQMRTYMNIYMIIIFRRLFETRNRVFIAICRYYDLTKIYEKERRSPDECAQLRIMLEKKLRRLLESHDFEVYTHYFQFLLFQVLSPAKHTKSLILDSLIILGEFCDMMRRGSSRMESRVAPWKCNTVVKTYDFFGLLFPLEQKCHTKLLSQLSMDPIPPPNNRVLSFCIISPVHSSHGWLFHLLKIAYGLDFPPGLCGCLENIHFSMESCRSYSNKSKNMWCRLMVLLLRFVEMVKSEHKQKHFLFDCISFMKETSGSILELERFLNLYSYQDISNKWIIFDIVFRHYLKFTNPGHSQPTARKLLSFFEKMHRIFSNERFLRIVQEFIQEFLKAINDKSRLWSCPYSICNSFLDNLSKNPKFYWVVQGICYFRRTICERCNIRLHDRNDSGLCDPCSQFVFNSCNGYSSDEDSSDGSRW
jgi:hypothetical protein